MVCWAKTTHWKQIKPLAPENLEECKAVVGERMVFDVSLAVRQDFRMEEEKWISS